MTRHAALLGLVALILSSFAAPVAVGNNPDGFSEEGPVAQSVKPDRTIRYADACANITRQYRACWTEYLRRLRKCQKTSTNSVCYAKTRIAAAREKCQEMSAALKRKCNL